jgi:hypothetical protein
MVIENLVISCLPQALTDTSNNEKGNKIAFFPQPHSHFFKTLEGGGSFRPPQTNSNPDPNHFGYVAIKKEMIPSF